MERFEQRERIAAANALRAVLRPNSVAVIGASRDRESIPGRLFWNLLAYGFTGRVYPVNPRTPVVQGVGGVKPVLVVFMTAEGIPQALTRGEPRLPVYPFPERAAIALARAARYGEWRNRPIPPYSPPAGIRREEAAAEVALKAIAPGLLHKSEAGGVRLGLRGREAVQRAAEEMQVRLRQAGISPTGFLLQPMAPPGIEMIVGVVHDPTFGPHERVPRVTRRRCRHAEGRTDRSPGRPAYSTRPIFPGTGALQTGRGGAKVNLQRVPVLNIRWHGRGGLGAKTAALMLAEAVIDLGGYAQASPEFGPERRGAPVQAYTRIAPHPIRHRGPIEEPDVVVVLDDRLLGAPETLQGVRPDTWVVVNTARPRPMPGVPLDQVLAVDASGIARRFLGRDLPNVAMLAVVAVNVVGLPPSAFFGWLAHRLRREFPEEVAAANLEAARAAVEEGRWWHERRGRPLTPVP